MSLLTMIMNSERAKDLSNRMSKLDRWDALIREYEMEFDKNDISDKMRQAALFAMAREAVVEEKVRCIINEPPPDVDRGSDASSVQKLAESLTLSFETLNSATKRKGKGKGKKRGSGTIELRWAFRALDPGCNVIVGECWLLLQGVGTGRHGRASCSRSSRWWPRTEMLFFSLATVTSCCPLSIRDHLQPLRLHTIDRCGRQCWRPPLGLPSLSRATEVKSLVSVTSATSMTEHDHNVYRRSKQACRLHCTRRATDSSEIEYFSWMFSECLCGHACPVSLRQENELHQRQWTRGHAAVTCER